MGDVAVDPLLRALLLAGLALLFGAAATHKLRDLTGFRLALRGYALLPERAVWPVAVALPACEIALAATLVVGIGAVDASPSASFASAGLLSLYLAAIAVNLARGRHDIDCGCMGPAGRRGIGPGLVVRNAALVGVALASALPPSARPFHWLDVWTAASALAFAVLLFGAVQVLLVNAPGLAALRAPATGALGPEDDRR